MSAQKLVEGRDYYFDEKGLMVLTSEYLLNRGYCCENGCRHCPYAFNSSQANTPQKESSPKNTKPSDPESS